MGVELTGGFPRLGVCVYNSYGRRRLQSQRQQRQRQ